MYEYLNGKVTDIESGYITIDISGVGYKVLTPSPYSFEEDEVYKVYLYNYIKEDEYTLYGFKSKEERELFLKLINVKGLGPKTALPILATGSINAVIDAIDRENILYLTKFPKVGDKLARQIILDLKGKLVSNDKPVELTDELTQALLSLGYKTPDIKRVIKDVDKNAVIENQIKEALKLLLR